MRREPYTSLTALHMPTAQEVDRYGKTHNPAEGPNLEPLRIDIATSSIASLWNKRAADLVSSHLCHEPGSSNLDQKHVARSVTTHFAALRRQYLQGLGSIGNERDRQNMIDQSRRLARTTRHRAVRQTFIHYTPRPPSHKNNPTYCSYCDTVPMLV